MFWGADPNHPECDNDGLSHGQEVSLGIGPLDANGDGGGCG
jgi:hypothetical protein